MDFVRRWFSRRSQRPAPRLSAAEACSIARDAAATSAPELPGDMTRADCRDEEGRLVWHVSSATIGSGLTVRIDDATGNVIDVQRWGVR